MSSTRRCACRAQVARSQLRALDARPAPAYEHQHSLLHPLLAGSCTRTHTRTRTGWAVDIDGVFVGSASSQTHTPPPTKHVPRTLSSTSRDTERQRDRETERLKGW